MRVAVTGTPGTGKTSATKRVKTDLEVIHLNDVVRERDLASGVDEARGSLVVDLDAVRDWLGDRDDVLVESHLAHHLDADRVVVLRCHPPSLERRLRDRGESGEKARENAESEALDVILSEAVTTHGTEHVYEIDTTDSTAEEVARGIEAVIEGEQKPAAGTVDFTEYLRNEDA